MTEPDAVLRVVVADDQRAVREALGTLLDVLPGFEVAGLAADGEEAVAMAT
jgi:DNA-binding NarL/FixJ family response regulator